MLSVHVWTECQCLQVQESREAPQRSCSALLENANNRVTAHWLLPVTRHLQQWGLLRLYNTTTLWFLCFRIEDEAIQLLHNRDWKPVKTRLEASNRIRLFPVSRGFWESFSSLLDKDSVLLLIVVQAEAVAGAEGHQFPLRVQVESGDHGRRLALD